MIYINRELSWLKFNKRVLEEAQAPSVPEFERLKFISIFTSNLDEFFMVRAGSMYDRSLLSIDIPDNKTGMSSKEQFEAIFRDTHPLYRLRDVYFNNVRTGCSGKGATCKSTSRSPGLRGVPRSTLYSFTAAPRSRTCSTSTSNGLPNGTSSRRK